MASVPNSKAVRAAMKGNLEKAMVIVTEDLLGRSMRQVPRDEGELAGTGTASVEVHGDQVLGRVSFDKPYAARQHEELNYTHPKGGKAKYLEDPLTEMAPRYTAAIAAVIKRGLKNGRS